MLKKSPMVWLHAEYETLDGKTFTLIFRRAQLSGDAYISGNQYMPVKLEKYWAA